MLHVVTYALLGLSLTSLAYILYAIVWPYICSWPQRIKLRHIPGPPGRIFLGNVFDLAYKPVHHQMIKWTEEYGPIFKLSFPGAMVVVLTEPEAVARVIKVERYDKSERMYRLFEQVTSETHPNMLTVPTGPYYRAVRKAVTPAFSSTNLRQFFPELVSLTEHLVEQLMTHGSVVPVDVDGAAQRLTIDVIGRFAFDRDFGALGFGRSEALEVVSSLMLSLQKSQNPLNRWFWWCKEARDLWAARLRFDALVRQILDELRQQPPAAHCLLSHLLSCTDPNTGKPLSAKRLRCETALFWIAGFETTAHAIAWSLLFLAGDEEAEARLAEELDACGLLATAAQPKPRPLAWGDLGRLRYLNAVIQEALRLMPPAAGGSIRATPRDTQLAGKDVPAGVAVWIPLYAMQRSSRTWGRDAQKFRPERWLAAPSRPQEQQQEGKLPQGQQEGVANGGSGGGAGRTAATSAAVMAVDEEDEVVKAAATTAARGWLPFSEGPRNCVGQSLALLELRTTLALLCGRFRFRLAEEMGGVEGVVAASRQEITLKPGGKGLLMHVIPRVTA